MRIYRDSGFRTHYLLSFIGGSMEIISFAYFYKALIGFMTSNMLFSVAFLYDGKYDFPSIYHALIILIWVVIATIYQFIAIKYKTALTRLQEEKSIFYILNFALLMIFMFYGHCEWVNHIFGDKPTPAILPLVSLGLLIMFIHNFVIKTGRSKYPTNTAAVTSTYIMMATAFTNAFEEHDKRNFVMKSQQAKHYFLVLFHYFIGASVTYLLQKYMDFFSLILSLMILGGLIYTERHPTER
ncbi:DUF1275 domain-containing protein [Pantoea sp. ICBG 1758]|uniref:DUF1275 family protein n=1 Tax=Pantoea sp. ICBG 1758 TaxID=2071682 RepID=UPI000CE527B4|nr:DUF1275 family protein [Pantoea sp. ICBG 1758]PPC63854.1 DUF1275 domain-containing protein [Pantoea sp. ICBG 1758]